MPQKPKPTRVSHGKVVANELSTAARGALHEESAMRRDFAIEAELADIEAGGTTKGRYVRLRNAIMTRFNCSQATAERAIQRAKIYLAERFDAELPARRAEVCRQLQRIADSQEEAHPVAAVAAIREQAKILGLYAAKEIKVTHGTTPELALQLDAILAILSDTGRAALDVVMAEIEAAKREGRLALPAGDDAEPDAADDDDEVEDAEIVDDPGSAGGDPAPGGN